MDLNEARAVVAEFFDYWKDKPGNKGPGKDMMRALSVLLVETGDVPVTREAVKEDQRADLKVNVRLTADSEDVLVRLIKAIENRKR